MPHELKCPVQSRCGSTSATFCARYTALLRNHNMFPTLGGWIKAPSLDTAVNIKIKIVCSFYNRLFLHMIILTDLPYACFIQILSHLNTGDQTQAITPVSNTAPYPSPLEIFPQTNLCIFAVIIVMAHVGSFCPSAGGLLLSLLPPVSSAVRAGCKQLRGPALSQHP